MGFYITKLLSLLFGELTYLVFWHFQSESEVCWKVAHARVMKIRTQNFSCRFLVLHYFCLKQLFTVHPATCRFTSSSHSAANMHARSPCPPIYTHQNTGLLTSATIPIFWLALCDPVLSFCKLLLRLISSYSAAGSYPRSPLVFPFQSVQFRLDTNDYFTLTTVGSSRLGLSTPGNICLASQTYAIFAFLHSSTQYTGAAAIVGQAVIF